MNGLKNLSEGAILRWQQKHKSEKKRRKLQDILRKIGKVAVTYSGGIDSSYLLKVALDTLGPDNVIAAVVNSELFSEEEFNLALDLADQLGAPVLGLEMRIE